MASRSRSNRSATSRSLLDTSTGLAEPNGLDLVVFAVLEIDNMESPLGEAKGVELMELPPERGSSSSFLRPIGGVEGMEFEGEPRLFGLGRRQSLSSGGPSFGGPMSPRLRILPKRLDCASSVDGLGLNFEPMDQASSESAAPAETTAKPAPLRFGGSDSADFDGRDERH